VISFGGRALDPAARAKYLNGPDSPVFHKGRVLYGLPEARRLLPSDPREAVLAVVEGYMDVIACQRAGVAAVAAMGTALGEEQMELLWRIHPEPTLCFDGDKAGQNAARRTVERAMPLLGATRTFRFATPKGGKDPDDVLREQGAEAVVAQMRDSMPMVDALWSMELHAERLGTPEARTGLRVRLKAAAGAIKDRDLSESYRRDLLGRFEAMFAAPQARNHYERNRAVPPVTLGASAALKAAANGLRLGKDRLYVLLDRPGLSEAEALLADLLMTREELDRSIAGLAADITAPGAIADIARLKADRAALEDRIREAQHNAKGRAA
jgi:DNA primase